MAPVGLRHSVIVFTGWTEGVLNEADRDLLWRVFRVPLFEYFLAFDGTPAAAECDAHDGMHLRTEQVMVEFAREDLLVTPLGDPEAPALRVRTGLTADVRLTPCGCGQPGVRLASLRRVAANRAARVEPAWV